MNSTSTLQPLSEEEAARLASGSDAPAAGDAATAGARADDELPISADDLFHLLQNSRRRAVVRYLRDREGPVRMRDVAEQVAAWEHDTTVAQLSSDERQRVYIALYQSHLETLDGAGVIEYNKPRGVIEPQPLLDRIASYVDVDLSEAAGAAEADAADDAADDDGWGRRYLGVSAVGSVLLLGVAVDLTALQAVSGFAVSALVLLMFSVLTLARLTLDGADPTEGV